MFGAYTRLGVHVGASNRDVIRAASRKLKKRFRFARKHRAARHKFYRQMLRHHRDHRKLVRAFNL